MNKELETYTRKRIKELIEECQESQKIVFKRCFSFNDLTLDLDTIVKNIPEEKLDHALSLCQRTVENNNKKEGSIEQFGWLARL